MPFASKQQAKWMFSQKPEMAKRWAAHTPDMKKLPAKKTKDDVEEKKAFVVAFLAKCAADGLTTPRQIADAAEKLAGAGELLGGVTGGVLLGGAAGLAIPTALGYAGGRVAGVARNQMDVDDAETMRLKAEANAYRRRAAEARLGAQVRKIVATDPKKYVVLS